MRHILFGSNLDFETGVYAGLDSKRYSAVFHSFPGIDLEDYDGIVPLRLADIAALRARPPAHRRFLLPDEATVRLCNDKLALNRFLIDAGLGRIVPALYPDAARARLPYMLKKREDEAGCHSVVVRHRGDDAPALARMNGEPSFRQEAIFGDHEWAAHFLALDGEVLFTCHVRYRLHSGQTVMGIRQPPRERTVLPAQKLDPRLAEAVRALRFTGTGCIDYRFREGVPMLFEINPRFGWSLQFDINRYLDHLLDVVALPAGAA